MPAATPKNVKPLPPREPVRQRLAAATRRAVPSRSRVAYALVGLSPVLVGFGVGTELGTGWGLVAAGIGSFGVGWLLGAE